MKDKPLNQCFFNGCVPRSSIPHMSVRPSIRCSHLINVYEPFRSPPPLNDLYRCACPSTGSTCSHTLKTIVRPILSVRPSVVKDAVYGRRKSKVLKHFTGYIRSLRFLSLCWHTLISSVKRLVTRLFWDTRGNKKWDKIEKWRKRKLTPNFLRESFSEARILK